MNEFDKLIKSYCTGVTIGQRRGSFTSALRKFYPVYMEYKQTVSYAALKRKLEETDRVMGKIYIDGDEDDFCGNVSKETGLIRLTQQFDKNMGGIVKECIDVGKTVGQEN